MQTNQSPRSRANTQPTNTSSGSAEFQWTMNAFSKIDHRLDKLEDKAQLLYSRDDKIADRLKAVITVGKKAERSIKHVHTSIVSVDQEVKELKNCMNSDTTAKWIKFGVTIFTVIVVGVTIWVVDAMFQMNGTTATNTATIESVKDSVKKLETSQKEIDSKLDKILKQLEKSNQ